MAPSRSTHANLTANNKMELAETGPPVRMFHPSSASPSAHPQQQQQQQQQPQSPYRFGAPDSRASYSERRVMGSSSVRSTAHNHPSGSSGPNGAWHSSHHQDAKSGRSFSSGLAALSRSNGSLAVSNPSSAGSNSPANETDANGNSKPRSRTQVRLHLSFSLSLSESENLFRPTTPSHSINFSVWGYQSDQKCTSYP